MREVKVLVPNERVAEFYTWFGAWLAGPDASARSASRPAGADEALAPWSDTADDRSLARNYWSKLSGPARKLFTILIDAPGETVSGEELAREADIERGVSGVAGVLAWPGRYARQIGKEWIWDYEWAPEGGQYWMKPDVAAIFSQAREAES